MSSTEVSSPILWADVVLEVVDKHPSRKQLEEQITLLALSGYTPSDPERQFLTAQLRRLIEQRSGD